MIYLGDYTDDQTVRFMWNTTAIAGESITRATNGTISVYKDGGTTQTTTGVADTEDFDGLTGVHLCVITTTDSFYVVGSDYSVVLSAATVDGNVINAVLAEFSIRNRGITLAQINAECDTALADYAAAILEGTITRDQATRINLSALAGKVSGAATSTNNFRDTADTKNRIVSTVDVDGNRTAVVLDGS